MDRITLSLVSLLILFSASAQQMPVATQFWNVNLYYNPAVAGLNYRHEANLYYQTDFDRTTANAQTGFANYSAKVNPIHGGAGFSYVYDDVFSNKQHDILAHYAFHLPLGQNVLSFGASGGVIVRETFDGWIPSQTTNDPLLPNTGTQSEFTMNLGVALHAEKWNAGVSVTRLNEPEFRYYSNSYYNLVRTYWFFADYRFDLTDNFSLKPQMQLFTDGITTDGNISLLANAKGFWGGVVYGFDNDPGVMIGYDVLGKYRVGYSYQAVFSNLNNGKSYGTHGLTLGFLLK